MRRSALRREMMRHFSLMTSTLPAHNPASVLTGEESKLRLLALKIYGRYEVQLLKVFYAIFQSPLAKNPITRKLLFYSSGKFMAERAIAGQPMTLEEAERFVDDMPDDAAIALGPCRCRLAAASKAGCTHPVETDIVIMTGTPLWLANFPHDYRVISKEETKQVMRNATDKGLFQSVFRHMYFGGSRNYFVICNCCKDVCVPTIGYRIFKPEGLKFIDSASIARGGSDLCKGCGTCVEVCPFEERELRAEKSVTLNCQGCGLCARACPEKAITMVARV
ncbi:MAG: 4Fe-4S dicluster domain-containing protein [Candidatus Geothermincolia bacterium]